MLMPKRLKPGQRKQHRGRMKGRATAGNTIAFGEAGLQATEPGWLESRQIEAARRAITHHIKRGGQVFIRVFPDKPVTKKPAETRMGSGKGAPDHWVAVIRPGTLIFEVAGIRTDIAKEALRLASHKLPMHTKVITRDETTPETVDETASVPEEAADHAAN